MRALDIAKLSDSFAKKALEMETHEKMRTYSAQIQVLALFEIAQQLAELNESLSQAQGPKWLNSFHVTSHPSERGGDK